MAAVKHAHLVKDLGQPAQETRHAMRLLAGLAHDGQVVLRIAPRLLGPMIQSADVGFGQLHHFVEVIVEHDVAHIVPANGLDDLVGGVDHVGFATQLHAQVRAKLGPHFIQRRKKQFRVIR